MARKRNSVDLDLMDDEDDAFMNRRSMVSNDDEEEETNGAQMFTSQAPELTQDIPQVKQSERNKLMEMSANQREKAVTDLSRLVLFKALAGEAIDKAKCIKEAGIADSRISSAAFEQVKKTLDDCFGFSVKRLPEWMEGIKGISKAQKERYYVTNGLLEADGAHSRDMHMVHEQPSIEKGFLMIVLGFIYCKGEPRNDGSRWITDKDLYTLLHRIDDNIPSEPPTAKRLKAAASALSSTQASSRFVGGTGAAQTPDVDFLLAKFCQRDYLIKEKATDPQQMGDVEDDCFSYSMGPRSAIEIGRRQVIFFCAEILDEEPDPTMLQELDAADAALDLDNAE
jgi:MAGE family